MAENEMVERVVATLLAELGGVMAWSDKDPTKVPIEGDVNVVALARAAIAAMRDPTPQMGVAAYPAWDKFGDDAILGPEEVLAIWRAMIDTALE